MTQVHTYLLLSCYLLYTAYCHSTRPEKIFLNWTSSSTRFQKENGCSIVGYDEDQEKVIIVGGIKNESETLYIYDILQDQLSTVPIGWNMVTESCGDLMNCITTNAVVINSTMYFTIDKCILEVDLNPFYLYTLQHSTSAAPDIQPQILLDSWSSQSTYTGLGCIVTDDTKQYLVISAMRDSKQTILYHIQTGSYWIGGESSYFHQLGVCVVLYGTFYVIGGWDTNTTEYIQIPMLFGDDIDKLHAKYNHDLQIDIGRAVIVDDESKLIYLLGGLMYRTDIYYMDVTDYGSATMELSNITLPVAIISSTTVLSKQTRKVYVFRGVFGEWSDQIRFTSDMLPIGSIPSTTAAPTIGYQITSNGASSSALSLTAEIILGIIIIGVICVCATIGIGACVMNKMKKNIQQTHTAVSPTESDTDALCFVDEVENADSTDDDNDIIKDMDYKPTATGQGMFVMSFYRDGNSYNCKGTETKTM